jgi:hypothetical protein
MSNKYAVLALLDENVVSPIKHYDLAILKLLLEYTVDSAGILHLVLVLVELLSSISHFCPHTYISAFPALIDVARPPLDTISNSHPPANEHSTVGVDPEMARGFDTD